MKRNINAAGQKQISTERVAVEIWRFQCTRRTKLSISPPERDQIPFLQLHTDLCASHSWWMCWDTHCSLVPAQSSYSLLWLQPRAEGTACRGADVGLIPVSSLHAGKHQQPDCNYNFRKLFAVPILFHLP